MIAIFIFMFQEFQGISQLFFFRFYIFHFNKPEFIKLIYPLRFFRVSGLFEIIIPTVWHFSKSGQSPHVVTLFFSAHWRIAQRLSQYKVLIPSTRQPSQLICSGRMGHHLTWPIILQFSHATLGHHWSLQDMRRIFHSSAHNKQSYPSWLCTS